METIGLEIVRTLVLFVIAVEGALILYGKDTTTKKVESAHTSRREVYGTFHNPLGDTYRKNSRSQYVPIHPGAKMLDGDEDDGV